MNAQLIPSVQKRISTWIELQQKRQAEDLKPSVPKPTITISRQFGCEGFPLASALKEILDRKTGEEWTIFDDTLVNNIVSDTAISKHLVKSQGDRAKYLDYIVSALLPNWKSEAEIFKLTTEAIFSVARQGNAIIVGRGAFAVTRNLPNCFHFRMIAPVEYRAESYARRVQIPIEEARRQVEKKESERQKFLSHYLNNDFDLENFHMIINNAKMPIERIANTVICFLDDLI